MSPASVPAPMGRTGRGRTHAAVGILNATATGIGCSLAVAGGVEAEWAWTDAGGLRFEGPCDDRLARAVAARVRPPGGPSHGAHVRTASSFPPSRGLKTSSAAALALVRAARAAAGEAPDPERDTADAIAASQDAGVALTGAFDDQVAVRDGGCHLADNRARRVIARVPVPAWHVAVWVPEAAIPKHTLRSVDASALSPDLALLPGLVRRGQVPEALTRSGAAFLRLYAQAGLPVTGEPAAVALAHGALGAGLSGTGPAVAALFDSPTRLPEVPGGAWAWVRAVEAGGT